MRQITEIGSEATQLLQVVGENNERIDFTLYYKPSQQSWYFDIVYLEFELRGVKMVNNPNLLRNYRNLLPFGINCIVEDGTDPYFIDDFTTGRVIVNLLTEAEVEEIEENIFS